jgi:hypothetical protein
LVEMSWHRPRSMPPMLIRGGTSGPGRRHILRSRRGAGPTPVRTGHFPGTTKFGTTAYVARISIVARSARPPVGSLALVSDESLDLAPARTLAVKTSSVEVRSSKTLSPSLTAVPRAEDGSSASAPGCSSACYWAPISRQGPAWPSKPMSWR